MSMRTILAATGLLILGTACGTLTSTDAVYRAEGYEDKTVEKILVIGAEDELEVRTRYENALTAALTETGIEAIAGHTVLPGAEELNRETVLAAVEEIGADSVIVTSLLKVNKVYKAHDPAPHVNMAYHDWYRYSYGRSTTAEVDEYEVLVLETRLFDTPTQLMVWGTRSETYDARDPDAMLQAVVGNLMDELRKAELIP